MLTTTEARRLVSEHLGNRPRARHSIFVGYAMRRLAEHLNTDAALYEIVGLVHDLDYEATAEDRTRHGLVATEWLTGRLPDEALTAIASHDHRTGVTSESALAVALKLSDALAVASAVLGSDHTADLLTRTDPGLGLRKAVEERPYLARIILETTATLRVPLSWLGEIVRSGPPAT